MKHLIPLLVLLIIALPRLIFVSTSSHFRSDESRDLVNIHQIFVEHKITLVGPISDANNYVYSSLTYYLFLPFATALNFSPLSTVLGASFYGILAAAILVLLIKRINTRLFWPGVLTIALWYPLVETSRWPWNPNFIPLWIALGLYFIDSHYPLLRFFAGISFGTLLHHHYTSGLITALAVIKSRQFYLLLGVLITILPFILFDLRHPPGLFLTTLTNYNAEAGQKLMIADIPYKTLSTLKFSLDYLFPSKGPVELAIILPLFILIYDLIKGRHLFLILGWLLPIIPLIIYTNQPQYLLPAVPFFIIWLVQNRSALIYKAQLLFLFFVIISSLIKLPSLILPSSTNDNPIAIWQISQLIHNQIKIQGLINPNLVVLASPDTYTSGKKYRDLLLIQNTPVKELSELSISDNLFVITTNPEKLRQDKALEMDLFRNGPIHQIWKIADTDWKVVQFNRY